MGVLGLGTTNHGVEGLASEADLLGAAMAARLASGVSPHRIMAYSDFGRVNGHPLACRFVVVTAFAVEPQQLCDPGTAPVKTRI